jgi:hypothetical protein
MAVNSINVTTLSIVRGCVFHRPGGHCYQYERRTATAKPAIATKLFHLFGLRPSWGLITVSRGTV